MRLRGLFKAHAPARKTPRDDAGDLNEAVESQVADTEPEPEMIATSEIKESVPPEHAIVSEPTDPVELLLFQVANTGIVQSLDIAKYSFDRPDMWTIEWRIEGDDGLEESGEIAHQSLAHALVAVVAQMLPRLRNSASVFVPSRESLESSAVMSDIIAMAAWAESGRDHMGATKTRFRFLGKKWIVEWESGDRERLVDRKGSLQRKEFGEAIREAFERTCARDLMSVSISPLPIKEGAA